MAVSDKKDRHRDKTSNNGSDRVFRTRFTLKSMEFKKTETHTTIVEKESGTVVDRIEFTIDIAFVNDFDLTGPGNVAARRVSMDYKSKIEMAKQLRNSVDAFKELASQDEHLEIASKHVNTAINYYGANVAAVFYRADSIRIKVSGKAMLQMYYAQLQSESIPCRYEYDDSHTQRMAARLSASMRRMRRRLCSRSF